MDPPKKKSTRVVKTFHSMLWLKKQSPPKDQAQCAVGPDGKVLPRKKTDEDYFPGTRDAKKVKKKKIKKPKMVLSLDSLNPSMDSPDLNEEPNPCSNSSNSEEKSLQTTVATDLVWSKDESTADKLFPNVQSVVIDRNDEVEMMNKALAESVATLQRESIERQAILEKNRWKEAMYGDADDEDEGGWNNVRRNLPSPLDHGRSTSNDNNNNSSSKPGILRNGQNNFNRILTEPESVDFGFRKLSESLKQEIKAGRSLKSVSFSEILLVEDPPRKYSEKEKSGKIVNGSKQKEPNIDKYGRVDGYSERRLFMGKGARMKELQYIQEIREQDSIPEDKSNLVQNTNHDEDLVAMQPPQEALKLEDKHRTAIEQPTFMGKGARKKELQYIQEIKEQDSIPEDKSNLVQNTNRGEDLVAMQPPQEALKLEDKHRTAIEQPTASIENPEEILAEVRTSMTEVVNPEVQNPERPRTEVENLELKKTEQPTTGVEQQPEQLEMLATEEKRESAEPEKPSVAVEIKKETDEQMTQMENQEPQQPAPAIVLENEMHLLIEPLVILPQMQDVRVLEENPTTAVETPITNQSEIPTTGIEMKESHSEKYSIIQRGSQDIRYKKNQPTTVIEKPEYRKPQKSKNGMEKPDELKIGMRNQSKKSTESKVLDQNKNSIKRPDKLNISSRNREESSIPLPSKTRGPKTTETKPGTSKKYKVKMVPCSTQTEDAKYESKVEMVSCSTQTEDGYEPGNKRSISNETGTRALVPTRVWDDTDKEDLKIDFKALDSIDGTPEPQFGSAASQNLLLTGVLAEDTNYEAWSPYTIPHYYQNQNNFVLNSVPSYSPQIPYQAFNNGHGYIPPHSPYNYGDGFGNVNNIVYEPVESREDLERENTNYSAYQLKSDYERRFKTAVTAPPGFVKSLQLPAGFTRNEKQTDNRDSSQSVKNMKNEFQQEKTAPDRTTVDRPGMKHQNKRKKFQKNQTRYYNKTITGIQPQDETRITYLQRQAQYYWHQYKLEAVKSRHPDSTSRKEAAQERSAIWVAKHSNVPSSDNNDFTESFDSLVDHRATTNSPHSEIPVVYQTPNQHSQGIGLAANWQFQPNAINVPAHMPVNWIRSGNQYVPPIQNTHNLASGFYKNMEYQQVQTQLMNQTPSAHETQVQQYPVVWNNNSNETVTSVSKGKGRGMRVHNK